MNPETSSSTDAATPGVDGATDVLAQATAVLQAHTDDRWVEVEGAVVERALEATRRSPSVRADALGGPVRVAEQVVVAYLRAALEDLSGCAPQRIVLRADATGRVTGVTVELVVQYLRPVLPLADQVRERAERVLHEVLGGLAPPVTVAAMHVHVGDVVPTDPAG